MSSGREQNGQEFCRVLGTTAARLSMPVHTRWPDIDRVRIPPSRSGEISMWRTSEGSGRTMEHEILIVDEEFANGIVSQFQHLLRLLRETGKKGERNRTGQKKGQALQS